MRKTETKDVLAGMGDSTTDYASQIQASLIGRILHNLEKYAGQGINSQRGSHDA